MDGGSVGPSLTEVAERLQSGYIYEYLIDPQRFKPDVVEPNYGFTSQQALELTKYLLSLKKQEQGVE